MSDEAIHSTPITSVRRAAVVVDNDLIERLLRGETLVAPPSMAASADSPTESQEPSIEAAATISQQGRVASSAALPTALELAGHGKLQEAISTLELALANGDDPLEISLALGQLHFECEHWTQAGICFAKIIHLDPNHAAAHHNLGLTLERQGKFGEAATEFEAAASLDQDLWQAHAALGMCLLHTGQPTLAGHCFDQALALNPNQPRSQFGKALTAHRLGRYQVAAEGYRVLLESGQVDDNSGDALRAERMAPNRGDLLINLMTASAALNRAEDARQYAEKILEIDPFNQSALEHLTALALTARDYSGALQPASRLVEIAPTAYSGWFNLGVSYHKTGQLERACESYQQAVALEPEAPEANANLGAVLQQSADREGARQAYQAALQSVPGLPGVLWNLALAAEEDGLLEEAELYLQQLLDQDASWGDAAFRLGYLQLQRGAFQAAQRSFLVCLEHRPDWMEALLNLGLACWQTEDLEAADSAFSRILELQPVHGDALKGLLAVSLEHKDTDRSWDLHSRLVSAGQNSLELSFNLGLLLQQSGDPARAAECYRRALQVQADYLPALVNLGHALEATGKQSEAHAAWSQAIAADTAMASSYFE